MQFQYNCHSQSSASSSPRSHSPTYDNIKRDGDWVCYYCQNYNYSFRRQCNRCHTLPYQIDYTQMYYQTHSDESNNIDIIQENNEDNFNIQHTTEQTFCYKVFFSFDKNLPEHFQIINSQISIEHRRKQYKQKLNQQQFKWVYQLLQQ